MKLSYKGMDIALDFEGEDHAEATIGGRTFALMRHGTPLPLWGCEEAYFMSEDVVDVVRHLVDYWYLLDDPGRAKFEGPRHGEIPEVPGGVISAHPTPPSELVPDDVEGGHRGHPGHGNQAGGKRSGGKRSGGRSGRR